MTQHSSNYGGSPLHPFLDSVSKLDLTPNQRAASLAALAMAAQNIGQHCIQYYEFVRNKQRYWSRILRLGMVLFGGLGFLMPLLKPWCANAADLGYIALALAAICVTSNNIFAASGNQSRFLLSRFKIEQLTTNFRLACASNQLSWDANGITDDQAKSAIDQAQAFLNSVFDVLSSETKDWSTEIQNAISEASRRLESKRT